MPGPLEGVVVLDTSWGLPGSLVGLLLADYGARVVKLERPGGGPDRGTVLRSVVERGKWSAEVDLTTEPGRDRFDSLLPGADVVIESYGPGRADKLGIGYEQIHQRFAHVVYCSITGYGHDGPWRDRPGFDALVAARLGLMAEQVGHRPGPIFLGHPSVDYCTAFVATIGVLAALRARRETGAGQLVDASLLDGTLALNSMNWWWNERNLSYLARSGTETGFGRNRLITDMFQCSDGEFIMVHTGGEGGFKRMMDILGLGERVRAVDGLEMSVPLDDDEYHAARHVVPETFRERPRAEWLALFHAADLAALPVLRPEEVLSDEQLDHAGVVIDIKDPVLGTIRQLGPVMRFADSPPAIPTAGPDVGTHNAEILGRSTPRDRPPTRADGRKLSHALDGIRVLDFSAFFATAYGARLLSDLGADVIKIESPGGDQMRPLPDLFEGAQRGKRTIALDLRLAEGRSIVHRLVQTADVVMHNFRPGKAEKLGIGYDTLRALNPKLIYCYLPGFGSSGPKAELKSFAPLVSGFTGLLYVGAGDGNPPNKRVLGNEDLYNGFSGAIAALMALEHRARTGHGQYVESPHLHSSLFVRTEQVVDSDSRPRSTLLLDRDQTGWGPLYRLYRTADGWLCIACVGDRAFRRLDDALGLGSLAGDPRFATASSRQRHGPELAALLEARFAQLRSDDAFAALDAAGVPCEIPSPDPVMPDFLWDEWAFETQRVLEHHHPEHGWIREMGLVVRLSDTPGKNKGTSPRLGEHTREILRELGYGADEVEAFTKRVCFAAPMPLQDQAPTESLPASGP